MKALLMRSYNPGEIVEVMKVTKELIEEVKGNKDNHVVNKLLCEVKTDEFDIKQWLVWNGSNIAIMEVQKQNNENIQADVNATINLKEGDHLVKSELGYKLVRLPMRLLSDKEEKLIEKYNKLGGH